MGSPLPPRDLQAVNGAIRVLTADDATPDAAWRTGQALGLDDAVTLALDVDARFALATAPHHPYLEGDQTRTAAPIPVTRRYLCSIAAMHYMHEQLVNERIRKLRDEIAVEWPVRSARRWLAAKCWADLAPHQPARRTARHWFRPRRRRRSRPPHPARDPRTIERSTGTPSTAPGTTSKRCRR